MLLSISSYFTCCKPSNSANDVEAGDIIPGMPKHKINANITYGLFKDFDISTGFICATGVF